MKVLNFQERIDFVNDVIGGCQVDDEYQPALFDVVFRLNVMKYFADVDYSAIPQSELTKCAYEDYDSAVGDVVSDAQIEGLRDACKEKINRQHHEFLTLATINKRDSFAELTDYIISYLDGMKAQMDGVDIKQLIDTASSLKDIDTNGKAAELVKAMRHVTNDATD